MWVHLTTLKIDPDKLEELKALLYTEEIAKISSEHGSLYGQLWQAEESGTVLSLTVWQSRAQGEAFYKTEKAAAVMGQLKPLFKAPPSAASYEVIVEKRPEDFG
jgi:quinol monooxygenase YgiN